MDALSSRLKRRGTIQVLISSVQQPVALMVWGSSSWSPKLPEVYEPFLIKDVPFPTFVSLSKFDFELCSVPLFLEFGVYFFTILFCMLINADKPFSFEEKHNNFRFQF